MGPDLVVVVVFFVAVPIGSFNDLVVVVVFVTVPNGSPHKAQSEILISAKSLLSRTPKVSSNRDCTLR